MSKIAFLLGEEFEDSEFRVPFDAVTKAGHEAVIVGARKGETVEGKRHKEQVDVQRTAGEDDPQQYDALVIPGGHSPDHLRIDPGVVQFVKDAIAAGKPIAAICHGPQLLVEADAGWLRGKQITSWPSVHKELELAGAQWVDREVAIDGELITSRNPHDAPAFARAIVEHLARSKPQAAAIR